MSLASFTGVLTPLNSAPLSAAMVFGVVGLAAAAGVANEYFRCEDLTGAGLGIAHKIILVAAGAASATAAKILANSVGGSFGERVVATARWAIRRAGRERREGGLEGL